MKTFLYTIAIVFMIGCHTSEPIPSVQYEIKWVEITDTLRLPNIAGMSNVYSTWGQLTGLVVRNTAEYYALVSMVNTNDPLYKPINLPPPPVDFSRYSMIGFKYNISVSDTLTSAVFINDSLQKYIYVVHDRNDDTLIPRLTLGGNQQNWIRIPSFKSGYTIQFDTSSAYLPNP